MELVGRCQCCNKAMYCIDGFFYGIVKEDGKPICFDCEKAKEEELQE